MAPDDRTRLRRAAHSFVGQHREACRETRSERGHQHAFRSAASRQHAFQHEQDARRRHVAIVAQHLARLGQLSRDEPEHLCKRVEDLGLRVDTRRESEHLTEFTVYTTALSMNYLVRGKFIHP